MYSRFFAASKKNEKNERSLRIMAKIFRSIWVIAYREFLHFIQDRSRMFSSFSMPILFLVIFGAGFGKLIGQMMPGMNYIQFMYPGILAM